MKHESAAARLRRLDGEIVMLSHIQAALEWDLETGMPAGGEEGRAAELSYLSRLIHEKAVSHEMADTLSALDGEGLDDADAAILRIRKKEYLEAVSVPPELVENLALEKGRAHGAWLRARESGDWNIFRPSLERLVALTEEKAAAMYGDRAPYDTLLSHYEDGMSAAILDPVFMETGRAIHRLLDELSGVRADDSFLHAGYDRGAMEAFCRRVITMMGFDWHRGAMGISAHPFTTVLGPDDVRITERFTDEGLFDPIGSAVHEAGHALYEMHASLNPAIRGTSAGSGVSMGIHESQSRFWENMIGRSPAFWEGMYPVLLEYFPQLSDITAEKFVKAINAFRPSAIRVNADELTYTLHIIVRYEAEKAMFSHSVPFGELPSYWNELSEKILMYRPADDREGILQDCHWAGGDFGYFPSYAVGNIYASSFFAAMRAELGGELDRALRSCDYTVITEWQDRNIWHCGGIYEPSELVRRVTGGGLDSACFINYLESRFKGLYL